VPIYSRPTKSLMLDWVKERNLQPREEFSKSEVMNWFAQHYSKIRPTTVSMHVNGMSINNRNRRHYPNIQPGSGHDLFFKLGPDRFRLWEEKVDPAPLYKPDIEASESGPIEEGEFEALEGEEAIQAAASREFAFERDLQNYLAKNLGAIEPGMILYEEEGITGIQFEVGGRFIDILAVDSKGGYVVIELKVSRGYDRVVGQLLRYMGWVDQNLGGSQPARGIIVAHEITNDLKLAASRIHGVRLIEYTISFALNPV